MNRRTLGFGAAATSIALLIAGCSSGSTSTSTKAGTATTASGGTQTVHIVQGGGSDFSDGDIYKAISLMEAEGIKVVSSVINDPSSALRAAISGQADIYLGSPGEAATAVGNGGANVKYIATTYQASSYVILAKPNVTTDNLKGKTLAIASPGSAGQVVSQAAFSKLGADASGVKYVTVGGTSARVTAILAGQVDMAPALAPAAIPAVATGKVKILINTGEVLGPYLQQGLITNGNFLKNTDLAQKVVAAFIDAERFSSTDEAGYLQLIQTNKLQGNLTADQQKAAYDQLLKGKYWATNGALCQASLDATLQYDYTSKALDKATMPKQADWVDMSFVQKYLTSKGDSADAC